MLNVQRERHTQHRSEIQFSRRLLRAHVALGWLPAALLLLHGLFFHCAVAATWYLLSLILVPLMKSGRDFARTGLGALFLAGFCGCLLLISRFPTVLPPASPPPLGHHLLPHWAGVFGAFYLILGLVFFLNRTVKKVVARGFDRW